MMQAPRAVCQKNPTGITLTYMPSRHPAIASQTWNMTRPDKVMMSRHHNRWDAQIISHSLGERNGQYRLSPVYLKEGEAKCSCAVRD